MRQSVHNRAQGEQRDAKAHESLVLASMLFEQLAGWARNHVVGRVLAGVSAASYVKGTPTEKTLGSDRPWDNPKLEQLGAAHDFIDAATNQRILAALMPEIRHVLDFRLAFQLSTAFQALQFGEVMPLTTPATSYFKGQGYALWQLRLKALQHVEFQRGTGLKKYEAQDVVAEAYGLGDKTSLGGRKTLDQWKRRIPSLFAPFMVNDALNFARSYGVQYAQLKGEKPLNEFDSEHLELIEGLYGRRALNRDGKLFRKARSE